MNISVLIKTESHYHIDKDRIRVVVEKYLTARGLKGSIELSISVVGDRFMRSINLKYRKLDETTSVLTFGLSEETSPHPFADPPDNILRLGDVIISYPQARERALEDEMLVDDKIDELVIHGLNNLLN